MTPASFRLPTGVKRHAAFLILFFSVLAIARGQNLCPDSIAVSTENVSCNGVNDGTISLHVFNSDGEDITDKGLAYNWTPAMSDVFTSQISGLLAPGTYSVTVTYLGGGCSLSAENIQIQGPAPMFINCFVLTSESTPGASDGVAKVDISGGTEPYTINWYGPVEGEISAIEGLNTLNNLQAGTYSVTVRDACSVDLFCTFTIQRCADLVTVAVQNPYCVNADGTITFTPNPVYQDRTFTYHWLHDDEHSFNASRNLSPGTYQAYVTDNTGCVTATFTQTITAPLTPMSLAVDTVIADDFTQAGGQGSISVSITGGTLPYSMVYGPSYTQMQPQNSLVSQNFTLPNLEHGLYIIDVRDSNGCMDTLNVAVQPGFFAEKESEFILDFTQVHDSLTSAILPFVNELRSKGGVLVDTCHCQGGAWKLQHWKTGPSDIIIIIDTTPPQGVQSAGKSDDNGWKGEIGTPDLEEQEASNETGACSYVAAQETDANFKVRVAIIDSGVNLRYKNANSGHPHLRGLDWTNPETNDAENCIEGDVHGYDFVNNTPIVVDNVGHGTHLAGAIARAFPKQVNLEIINLKVYDKEKLGNVFGLTCALYYAISNDAQVINLSLGYENEYPFEPLYNALKLADTLGILVVASAGNRNQNIDLPLSGVDVSKKRWPASFKADGIQTYDKKVLKPLHNLLVVASASEDSPNRIESEYSNWGSKLVDIATKGVNKSTYLQDTFYLLKGTSMATANVTREAALIRAYDKSMTPEAIISNMVNAVQTPFDPADPKKITARGILNKDSLYKYAAINPASHPVTRPLVYPATPQEAKPDFGRSNIVREKIDIYLGRRGVLYDDVKIEIKGGTPLTECYSRSFCSTNIIPWFGQNNEGIRLPEGWYEVMISINGVNLMTQPHKLLLENGQSATSTRSATSSQSPKRSKRDKKSTKRD